MFALQNCNEQFLKYAFRQSLFIGAQLQKEEVFALIKKLLA